MNTGSQLPPLTLKCRPFWRLVFVGAALAGLTVGTAEIALGEGLARYEWLRLAGAVVLLAAGSGCAYFAARYCFSRLILDDRGFRLAGPLATEEVMWGSVVDWGRRSGRGRLRVLRIVHGSERRRVSIPLIYEDSHVLEVGLAQRRFPVY